MTANTGEIHVQQTHPGCKLVKRCPNVSPRGTSAIAGGTGYDPRFQATWSSDGLSIMAHSVRTCRQICRGTARRVLGASSRVSGLAVNDRRSQLYQLETVAGQFAITVYDITKVAAASCFTFRSTCRGALPGKSDLAGGLAFDETRDLLYIATTGAGVHQVLVTRQAKPCTIACRYRIPQGSCLAAASQVTGCAFSDCKGVATVYVTNGVRHLELRMGNPLACQFTPGRCCNATGRFGGLALIPGWTLTHRGKSCLGQPCPNCVDMHIATGGGDPALGNPAFTVEVRNGPGGGLAGFFFRPGGFGLTIPLFCSTLHTEPFSLGPFAVPIGGAGCKGRAILPLAIPADRSLCGLKFAAQAIILCGGVGMTDAIEIEITSS